MISHGCRSSWNSIHRWSHQLPELYYSVMDIRPYCWVGWLVSFHIWFFTFTSSNNAFSFLFSNFFLSDIFSFFFLPPSTFFVLRAKITTFKLCKQLLVRPSMITINFRQNTMTFTWSFLYIKVMKMNCQQKQFFGSKFDIFEWKKIVFYASTEWHTLIVAIQSVFEILEQWYNNSVTPFLGKPTSRNMYWICLSFSVKFDIDCKISIKASLIYLGILLYA